MNPEGGPDGFTLNFDTNDLSDSFAREADMETTTTKDPNERAREYCGRIYGTKEINFKDTAEYIMVNNLQKMVGAAIVVFFINAAWILYDRFVNPQYEIMQPRLLIPLIAVNVLSVIILLLCVFWRKKDYRGPFIRIAFLVYFIAILVEITAQTMVKNVQVARLP